MSSGAHPQTDGVSEAANQVVVHMLRSFVKPNQQDWDTKLHMCEIAYNNSTCASTGFSPYYLVNGQHPVLPLTVFAPPKFRKTSSAERSVRECVERMQADMTLARQCMEKAQEKQAKYANMKRRDVQLAIGDLVLVDERHFDESSGLALVRPDQAIAKFSGRYRGPFKVTEVISRVVYRLDLPVTLQRTHNAFHISRLKIWHETEAFPAREALLAPQPEMVDGAEHHTIRAFVGHRTYGRKNHIQFLVEFQGLAHAREWHFAADLSRPPGLSQDAYADRVSIYIATNPRGSASGGRKPTKAEHTELRRVLLNEHDRAIWAAQQVTGGTKTGRDTEPHTVPPTTKLAAARPGGPITGAPATGTPAKGQEGVAPAVVDNTAGLRRSSRLRGGL
jgi:hypothetical protein